MFGALVAGVLTVAVLAGCLSEDQTTVQAQIIYSRAVNGVHQLADYGPADTKAQNWANHLASIGTIRHSSLTSGYRSGTWCRLGENVGMGPSLLAINNAFMNSPSHRANMLSSLYDHMGTGVAKRGNTYYVVHEFVDVC
ncbi:MAG TPA: CAP domain-containing protein [Acidimicrobiales bacterium]|nr:CAP domain-containing protein [Acidimicrobiales bacterium]